MRKIETTVLESLMQFSTLRLSAKWRATEYLSPLQDSRAELSKVLMRMVRNLVPQELYLKLKLGDACNLSVIPMELKSELAHAYVCSA